MNATAYYITICREIAASFLSGNITRAEANRLLRSERLAWLERRFTEGR